MKDERIGTVHRTQVIDQLNQAHGEGLLTTEQYDRRVVSVSTATYASDLLAQVQDLPPRLQWDPRNAAPPRRSMDGSPLRSARAAAVGPRRGADGPIAIYRYPGPLRPDQQVTLERVQEYVRRMPRERVCVATAHPQSHTRRTDSDTDLAVR